MRGTIRKFTALLLALVSINASIKALNFLYFFINTGNKMKDLIPNDVVELSKTEVCAAIKKNAESLAIYNAVDAVGNKQKTMRNKVRKTLSTLSVDGKSLAKLHELELVMNVFKVNKKIDNMRSFKSCIEWCFNDLVKDDSQPFFQKENRQSMKNVEVNTLQPCVMSIVGNANGGNKKKNATILEAATDDIIVNLIADDDNKFQPKNRILFETYTALDDNNELQVTDSELEYTIGLFENFTKELIKARLEALNQALIEETDEIVNAK